jgi:hypothetical protein
VCDEAIKDELEGFGGFGCKSNACDFAFGGRTKTSQGHARTEVKRPRPDRRDKPKRSFDTVGREVIKTSE